LTESTELLCPSCGHANPADAQFCRQCGAILVQSRDARKRESESPGPPLAPRIVEAASAPRRGALLAAVAGLLTLVVAFVVYQRFHTNELIPVPGDTTPPARPTEAPAEQAVVQPTASGQLREAPAKPEATAVREAARTLPTHEPFVEPTLAPRAAERREEAPPPRQPGWYRVRYRSPLFQAPSETAPIVTQLPAGTRIRVTRVLPGFLAVESTTGKAPGFVSSDDVLPESVAGPIR